MTYTTAASLLAVLPDDDDVPVYIATVVCGSNSDIVTVPVAVVEDGQLVLSMGHEWSDSAFEEEEEEVRSESRHDSPDLHWFPMSGPTVRTGLLRRLLSEVSPTSSVVARWPVPDSVESLPDRAADIAKTRLADVEDSKLRELASGLVAALEHLPEGLFRTHSAGVCAETQPSWFEEDIDVGDWQWRIGSRIATQEEIRAGLADFTNGGSVMSHIEGWNWGYRRHLMLTVDETPVGED